MSHFALNPKNHFLKKNLELLCIASTAVLISQVVSVLHFSQAGVAESNIKSSVCLFVSFKLPREYQISSDIVFRYSSTFQSFRHRRRRRRNTFMKSLHVLYIKRILPYSISAPAPHLKAHLEMAASHFMMCADGNLFYGTNLASK